MGDVKYATKSASLNFVLRITTRVRGVAFRLNRFSALAPDLGFAAIDYENRIFTEDLKVIEFLADKSVPLDRGQVHIRSDRHTVEFRRILLKLLNTSAE